MRAERITKRRQLLYSYRKPKHKISSSKLKLLNWNRDYRFIQTLTWIISNLLPEVSTNRETTAELIKFAKETNIPVILIGHITKDGNIAGPKIWTHGSTPFYSLKAIEIMHTVFTFLKTVLFTAEIDLWNVRQWFARSF
jgi:hypothetical protein